MIDLAAIRKYTLTLAEVEEKPHFGRPGFRVRNKLFASFHPDGDRPTLIVNVAKADASAAIAQDPTGLEEVWRTHGRNRIFVGLRIDVAAVAKARCQDLIKSAWRSKAPKGLAAEREKRA